MTPAHLPPPSPDDIGLHIPKAVQTGTTAHAVLCHMVDTPTDSLEALAAELGVRRIDVYAACSVLRYNGLLEGRYGTRNVTERGRAIVRATVKGARV